VSGYLRSEKQAERLLKSLMTKWSKLLRLWSDWVVEVAIAKGEDMNNDGWAAGFETAAECATHWEYRRGRMTFNGEWLRSAPASEIEETVVHEYQHLMLNHLRRRPKMDSEELTATMLTRAFMNVAGLESAL
jgi:hypothetical protein